MKDESVLGREVRNPFRWIIATVVVIFVFFAVMIVLERRAAHLWSPVARLEKVLWVAAPDYQHFYGPGTPQSRAYAAELFDNGYLSRSFRVPDLPILVVPATRGQPNSREDPVVIYNFTRTMAETLQRQHAPAGAKSGDEPPAR